VPSSGYYTRGGGISEAGIEQLVRKLYIDDTHTEQGAIMSLPNATRCGVLFTLFLACLTPATSQQLDCTVNVNYEAVGAANKDLLRDFASEVRNYLNNYQWGSEQLDEKVKCTVDIFIQTATGENKYMSQVFVGSQRQIFGSKKSTAVVRLFDEAWEFTYVKDRPINHNPHSFSDLASFLDFYVYLILGYDYDTYEPLGGTPWFQKASDIASLASTSSQKGWQLVTTGYSRTQLVTDLLNPTVNPIRGSIYRYHFRGLDSLAVDTQKGWANMRGALEQIGATKKGIDARNLVFKSFFDTKYLEIAEVFQEYPDPTIYIVLSKIDPYHQKTYDEYRLKKH
jgi:hypothetical protein